jgi:hypothetical protein
MPLTRIRRAASEEEAIEQVIRALGTEAAAQAIGRSRNYLLRAANPDDDVHLQLRDAQALDAACLAACNKAPITDWMVGQRQAAQRANAHCDLDAALTDLMADVGRVADDVRTMRRPDSPGGTALTEQERTRLVRDIDEAARELSDIRASVVNGAGNVQPIRPGDDAA